MKPSDVHRRHCVGTEVPCSELAGVVVIAPRAFCDDRGMFAEMYQRRRYEALGISEEFVQDNLSHSVHGTIRGLHYQQPHPQGKLVWVARGAVFDVVVDLRRDSPTLGCWAGLELDDRDRRQIYIPPGFAHGFCAVSETADVIYKCSDYYSQANEHTIRWDDPQLGIRWPTEAPIVSSKDANGARFSDAVLF